MIRKMVIGGFNHKGFLRMVLTVFLFNFSVTVSANCINIFYNYGKL